ncbi:hypothetical protein SH661x_001631 [Planctomicrobium sp. SH661]|uniref:hypothetical protein n=1 Tax=Planctomicrobium sp. SH661 TaxID=3448124 RepID=UPI003F5C83E2
MSFFDLSQGFWFALGMAPVVVMLYWSARYLENSILEDGKISEAERRENEAFERGYREGLRARWIETMNERLDQSISEKLADIRTVSRRETSSMSESGSGPHA